MVKQNQYKNEAFTSSCFIGSFVRSHRQVRVRTNAHIIACGVGYNYKLTNEVH